MADGTDDGANLALVVADIAAPGVGSIVSSLLSLSKVNERKLHKAMADEMVDAVLELEKEMKRVQAKLADLENRFEQLTAIRFQRVRAEFGRAVIEGATERKQRALMRAAANVQDAAFGLLETRMRMFQTLLELPNSAFFALELVANAERRRATLPRQELPKPYVVSDTRTFREGVEALPDVFRSSSVSSGKVNQSHYSLTPHGLEFARFAGFVQ